jgi:predicted acyl esterase
MVFDSEPLEEDVEVLDSTRVRLRLSTSEPVAMVTARLRDVSSEGSATRVTYGLLNLTHRDRGTRRGARWYPASPATWNWP